MIGVFLTVFTVAPIVLTALLMGVDPLAVAVVVVFSTITVILSHRWLSKNVDGWLGGGKGS